MRRAVQTETLMARLIRVEGSGEMQRASVADDLLLKMLVGDVGQVGEHFAAWQAITNFETDIVGDRYRLMPLLYRRLCLIGMADPVMGRMKGLYKRQWTELQRTRLAWAQVLAKLEQVGLVPLVLGGLPLALCAYAEDGTRPALTLELVLPRTEGVRALAVLHDLGWHGNYFGPSIPHDVISTEAWNDKGLCIQLAFHCVGAVPCDEADAWFRGNAKSHELFGVVAQLPSNTGLLLHTLLSEFRARSPDCILWIVDSAMIVGQGHVDWDALLEFAKHYSLTRRLRSRLSVLSGSYGVAVPDRVIVAMAQTPLSLVERIEAHTDQGRWPPLPVADHWRFLRGETPVPFVLGYTRAVARRAGLRNPRWVLARTAHRLRHKLARWV